MRIPKLKRIFIYFLLIIGMPILNLAARKRNGFRTEPQVVIHRVGQCPNRMDLPIIVGPLKITQSGRMKYFIEGNSTISEDFDHGFRVFYDLLTCKDLDLPDTCVVMHHDLGNNDLCILLRIPLPVYKRGIESMTPIPKCPLKKGTYILPRITTDNVFLKYMYIAESFTKASLWKVVITGRIKNRTVACFSNEFAIVQRRVMG